MDNSEVHPTLTTTDQFYFKVTTGLPRTLSINTKLAHKEMEMIRMNSQNRDNCYEELKVAALTGFYPNFTKLLKVALTLPVEIATCGPSRPFEGEKLVANHNGARETVAIVLVTYRKRFNQEY